MKEIERVSFVIFLSAMILVAFCRTLGSAPAPGKAALNRAVIPGLEAIPALIAPCLHESAHNPTAGTCSSMLLTLLAASASALSLDSANSPIFEALDILVALSFTDVVCYSKCINTNVLYSKLRIQQINKIVILCQV